MKLDFLRQIVNPVLEEYSKKGLLSARDSIEIKRRIYQAEEKYKFSIYNGDIVNLTRFLNSDDFAELVKYVVAINATRVLVEILERAINTYSENTELVRALENSLKKLRGRGSRRKKSKENQGSSNAS